MDNVISMMINVQSGGSSWRNEGTKGHNFVYVCQLYPPLAHAHVISARFSNRTLSREKVHLIAFDKFTMSTRRKKYSRQAKNRGERYGTSESGKNIKSANFFNK